MLPIVMIRFSNVLTGINDPLAEAEGAQNLQSLENAALTKDAAWRCQLLNN